MKRDCSKAGSADRDWHDGRAQWPGSRFGVLASADVQDIRQTRSDS